VSDYLARLSIHPGVFPATAMTAVFFVSALTGDAGFWCAVAVAFVATSPFWAIVLWTARTQPLPGEGSRQDRGQQP